MSVAFLPKFVDDELLFGILARHRRAVGFLPAAVHVRQLFGNSTAVAAVDMPVGLSALAERLDREHVDGHHLAFHHTLFPYYAAFQPTDRREQALGAITAGNAGGLKISLGIVAFRIQPVGGLRYCPDCVAASVAQVGEGCWLRAHQLPGSLVCHVHGSPLLSVDLDGRGRHEFHAPDPATLPMLDGFDVDDAVRDRLVAIAKAQASLLGELRPSMPLEHWGPHYHDRLAAVGFVPAGRHVDQARLEDDFRAFYGPALEMLPEEVSALGETGWLVAMSRRHRKAVHPLMHVLLSVFLDAQDAVPGPFGAGPWPCLNRLSDHHGAETIASMTHYSNRSARVGVFSCGCGHSYTRGLSKDGIVGPPRFRSGGPLLEAALRRLVVPGANLREVGRLTGLDPKTVIREAITLGLDIPWSTKPSGKAKRAMPEKPCDDVVVVRKAVRTPSARLEWDRVDGETVARILTAEGDLRGMMPPIRVTYQAIERMTVGNGWLRKRAAKLPRSHALLNSLVEPLSSFRRRRAEAVTADMPLAEAWRVLRLAGLPSSEMDMVRDVMRDQGRRLT